MTRTDDLLAGRYRLKSTIGRGGMGDVWLADDILLNRQVALKVVHVHRGLAPAHLAEHRERAKREARALSMVAHPAIVGIYDVFTHDGDPWIVMEYIRGRSLAMITASERLAEQDLARIALAVAGALQAVHRAKILHRDVKPANILIADDARVLLVDFGIAQIAGAEPLTATNSLIGTVPYLAPERILNAEPDGASDFWSLGITLFNALEGYSPFSGNNDAATMYAIVNSDVPELGHQGDIAEVVRRLLEKRPEKRIGAGELERLLQKTISGGSAGERTRRYEPDDDPGHHREDRTQLRLSATEIVRRHGGQPVRALAEVLGRVPPDTGRDVLAAISSVRAPRVLQALPAEQASRILAISPSRVGAAQLGAVVPAEAAARILVLLPVAHAARILAFMPQASAIALVSRMQPTDAAVCLAATEPRAVSKIILGLPLSLAVHLLESVTVHRACAILGYIPPSTTASLLRASSDGRAGQLLRGLGTGIRSEIERHLG